MDGFDLGAVFSVILFFVVLATAVLSVIGGLILEIATIVIGGVVGTFLLLLAAD